MYPHNWTASSIKVSNCGLYNLSKITPNHQAASSPLCQEPWGRGGLKMKEAHSPDPGWRVLTCEQPNTRQGPATERRPWLRAGDGVGKEPLPGRKHMPCECVCVCLDMCMNTPARVCVCVCCGGDYSHPWERNDFTGTPTLNTSPPTEQLLIPSTGFLSKALGTQILTIHSFS